MLGNIIVINRGDSWNLLLNLTDSEGNAYTPMLGYTDVVYFGLMDCHQHFEDALIKKRIVVTDSSQIVFKLSSADTVDLEPGIYYYAVKWHHVNKTKSVDEVITVISKTKFVIND